MYIRTIHYLFCTNSDAGNINGQHACKMSADQMCRDCVLRMQGYGHFICVIYLYGSLFVFSWHNMPISNKPYSVFIRGYVHVCKVVYMLQMDVRPFFPI